ncbi:MAG: hypothetical protein M3069_12785 [Chloroflexota bacterium]|nr:hypothetical protein [Chloroflexota bacterium]
MTASGRQPKFVSVFTIPKPFSGLAALQQRNAIGSWTRLGSDVEVILCADERGVADTALEFGARHVPDIPRNDHGTPLVSAAFAAASANSTAQLLCYVNADIVLMSDFVQALKRVNLARFLAAGRRCDLDFETPLDFESSSWQEDMRALAQTHGKMHGPEAMDYFAFPRGFIDTMPPFTVGRAMWDNWLVFHARALGGSVVDITHDTVVIHQNHDYAHVDAGQVGVWFGPEARANRRLARQMLYPFTLDDATLLLKDGKLVRQAGIPALLRSWQSMVALAVRRRPAVINFIRTALHAKEA